MAVAYLIVCCCIAAPHVLYAAIWFNPETWKRKFKSHAVESFARAAAVLKGVQFTAVGLWLVTHNGSLNPFQAHPLVWLLCSALLIAGQVLNVGIYQAIGKKGVYYGFKLGEPVPWHHGFPFNVVSHPQYVGSIMTVWGAGGLFWPHSPPGFFALLSFWTIMYIVTGLQEQFL